MKYNTILTNETKNNEILKELKATKNGLRKLHELKKFNPAKFETIELFKIENGFTFEGLSKLVNFEENNKAFIIECKNAKGEKTLYNDFDLWDDDFCWFTNCNNLETYRKNKKHNYYTYNVYILIQNKKYCNFRENYKIDYKNERFITENSSIYTKQNKKYITSKNDLKIDKSGYILPLRKMQELRYKAEIIRKEKQRKLFLNYNGFNDDIKKIENKKAEIIKLFNELKNNITNYKEFDHFISFYNSNDYIIENNLINYNKKIVGFNTILKYIDKILEKINIKNYDRLDNYFNDIKKIDSWSFNDNLKEFKKVVALDKIIDFVRDSEKVSYKYSGDLLKEKTIIQEENTFTYYINNKKYIINFNDLNITIE